MASGPIIILTALRNEGTAIARLMTLRNIGAGRYRSDPSGETELMVIGPGAASLPGALCGASWVIVAGLAGGLDPILRPGDVVVDGAPAGLDLGTGVRRARVATAEQIVATPADKAAVFGATGAGVADMEQRRVIAAFPSVRVVGVRVVLDTATETISPLLAGLVDRRGAVRPMSVARLAIRSPRAILGAARLGRRASRVLPRLAEAVASLVEGLRRA